MRKINIFFNRKYNCLERLLATVSDYYGVSHKIMFLDSWQLDYFENYSVYGNCMGCGKWHVEENIKKLSGISTQLIDACNEEDIYKILRQNSFVSLNDEYLIYDYNEEGFEAYSFRYDSFMTILKEDIKLYEVIKCITKEKDIDRKNIYDISSHVNCLNIERNYEKILDLFDTEFDFDKEISGCNEYEDVPIIGNIIDIGRGRGMFADAITEKNSSSLVNELSLQLKDIESKYMNIVAVLVKAFFGKNMENVGRIKSKLEQIRDLELKCLKLLTQL